MFCQRMVNEKNGQPAVMNAAETMDKTQEKHMYVTKIRMLLRWMGVVANIDGIRNKIIRGVTKASLI